MVRALPPASAGVSPLLLPATTDAELKRMVEYLKAENRILRDKLPDRITVSLRERNPLVRLGSKLGWGSRT